MHRHLRFSRRTLVNRFAIYPNPHMKRILLPLLAALCLATTACSKTDPKTASAPGMGTIHGIRMVIPAEYKFFGVEYEGDEIWARPPKRHQPGPDVPIRSFSILLHLPDFAPLNDGNRDSWIGLKGPDARRNEWTDVGIQPIDDIPKNSAEWFSSLITRQMKGKIEWRVAHDWYFEKQPDLVDGLVMEKLIGPDYSKISVDNIDIFFDPLRSKSYIVCGTGAGGPKYCNQTFFIPDLGVIVDATYARNNLKEWRNIQKNIEQIVLSFKQS